MKNEKQILELALELCDQLEASPDEDTLEGRLHHLLLDQKKRKYLAGGEVELEVLYSVREAAANGEGLDGEDGQILERALIRAEAERDLLRDFVFKRTPS